MRDKRMQSGKVPVKEIAKYLEISAPTIKSWISSIIKMNKHSLFGLIIIFICLNGCSLFKKPVEKGSDTAWYDQKTYIDSYEANKRNGIERFSQYIVMQDGVKIAVTVHLPKDRGKKEQFPTLLFQTRYWREFELKWPYSWFKGRFLGFGHEFTVGKGYAYVVADVRGTGASTGSRSTMWGTKEVDDSIEVIDWIITQPWSNGKIGLDGVSYAGVAAELTLAKTHPAVKAAVVIHTPFDAYQDLSNSGGLRNDFLIEDWHKFNHGLDNNCAVCALGESDGKYIKGVAPVDDDTDYEQLALAINDHKKNFSAVELAQSLEFRDDYYKFKAGINHAANDISPYNYSSIVSDAGIPIFDLSGWFDAGLANAAISRFLTYNSKWNKLILGPWAHADVTFSPYTTSRISGFYRVVEQFRFWDYHLKGIENGLYDEPPIHYFTMGKEKWKTSETWPPLNTKPVHYYFGKDSTLSLKAPSKDSGSDYYTVNFNTTSGKSHRWDLAGVTWQDDESISLYMERSAMQDKLLTYTFPALLNDLEVTGHAIAKIYLSSTTKDGALYVYLEDIWPDGKVTYVTEGCLRLSRHKLSTPPYVKPTALYHSFKRKDYSPLVPGEIYEIAIELQPVSYQYKKGHKIRISIAGADKGIFEQVPIKGKLPVYEIMRSKLYPSSIELPIIPGKL